MAQRSPFASDYFPSGTTPSRRRCQSRCYITVVASVAARFQHASRSADIFGGAITPNRVVRLSKSYGLPSHRVGRRRLFDADEVSACLPPPLTDLEAPTTLRHVSNADAVAFDQGLATLVSFYGCDDRGAWVSTFM